MTNSTKIFGWLLLGAGIIIIILALYSSYNIFTLKSAVPEIFPLPKETAATTTQGEITSIEDIQALLSQQLKGMIPVDTIPKLLNLLSWSVLATILIFGGGQIASLGIKLLKG